MASLKGHNQDRRSPLPSRRSARAAGLCVRVIVFALAAVLAAVPAASPAATAPADTLPSSAEAAATQLIKVVGQSDAATRREGAIAILRAGSADNIKSLLGVFEVENNEQAKIAVCEAIAELRSQVQDFVPKLEALLRNKNPAVRKAAAAALAGYSDPDVAARLAAYRHVQERAQMGESIERLMDTLYDTTTDEAKRVGLLQEWLKSPLTVMRLKAMQIISDALRGKGTKPANEVLAQIRPMLADGEEGVRQKVIGLLRDLGLPEDASRIRALLKTERSPAVREEIYKALGKLTDPASIEACIAGLTEPDEKVAAAAADAIGRLCEKGSGRPPEKVAAAVKAITALLARNIESPLLRRDLVEAMADIGDPSFTPLLIKYAAASELEPTIRQAALRGLERIGDPACVNVVLDHLTSDPDVGVREVAAHAAGVLANQPAQLQVIKTRLDRSVESAATVASAAWDAYLQVFQRLEAADQLVAFTSWNSSAPDRLVLLAAVVKAEIRPAVANKVLQYAETLNETDHAAAVAFLDQLAKTVPDRFGPAWAAKFDAIRNAPAPKAAQPATRSAKSAS